jgi:formylglycine-generating enzyme required for sulfatase activity
LAAHRACAPLLRLRSRRAHRRYRRRRNFRRTWTPSVSWRDAQEYVQWLSRETGRRYRLPTEAEWEYAARGDTTTQWPWGDDANQGCAFANFRDMTMNPRAGVTCSDGVGEVTAPVGSYRPNPFGLYDMHGNVFEWVQDCRPGGGEAPSDGAALESGNCGSRVIRGGAWNYSPESSTSWYTRGENQTTRGGSIGFRVATDAR